MLWFMVCCLQARVQGKHCKRDVCNPVNPFNGDKVCFAACCYDETRCKTCPEQNGYFEPCNDDSDCSGAPYGCEDGTCIEPWFSTGCGSKGTCDTSNGAFDPNSGFCSSCFEYWNGWGPNCNSPVTCQKERGNTLDPSTGKCSLCEDLWQGWGPNCDKSVTCTPSQGLTVDPATGACASCALEWAGRNCETRVKCDPEVGRPSRGINGTGNCESCTSANYTGELCDACLNGGWGMTCNSQYACNCSSGTCNTGPLGDGLCSTCCQGHYSATCSPCKCVPEQGVCRDTITGDGLCANCIGNYYGPTCANPSHCPNGIPWNGPIGNGSCQACSDNFEMPDCSECVSATRWGPQCDKECSLRCNTTRGLCKAGVDGNGYCSSCFNSSYYQDDCAYSCLTKPQNGCSSGKCMQNDGKCLCPLGTEPVVTTGLLQLVECRACASGFSNPLAWNAGSCQSMCPTSLYDSVSNQCVPCDEKYPCFDGHYITEPPTWWQSDLKIVGYITTSLAAIYLLYKLFKLLKLRWQGRLKGGLNCKSCFAVVVAARGSVGDHMIEPEDPLLGSGDHIEPLLGPVNAGA